MLKICVIFEKNAEPVPDAMWLITIAHFDFTQRKPRSLKRKNITNEREEFKQETQHTQQTATRKAQNQDKKGAPFYMKWSFRKIGCSIQYQSDA